MRILSHGPEHCFLYHLVCPLYFVNISMTGAYSGIYVKPAFDIPPKSKSKTLKFSLFFKMAKYGRITNISNTLSPLGFNRMLSKFQNS